MVLMALMGSGRTTRRITIPDEYELLEQIVVENELALVVLDPINSSSRQASTRTVTPRSAGCSTRSPRSARAGTSRRSLSSISTAAPTPTCSTGSPARAATAARPARSSPSAGTPRTTRSVSSQPRGTGRRRAHSDLFELREIVVFPDADPEDQTQPALVHIGVTELDSSDLIDSLTTTAPRSSRRRSSCSASSRRRRPGHRPPARRRGERALVADGRAGEEAARRRGETDLVGGLAPGRRPLGVVPRAAGRHARRPANEVAHLRRSRAPPGDPRPRDPVRPPVARHRDDPLPPPRRAARPGHPHVPRLPQRGVGEVGRRFTAQGRPAEREGHVSAIPGPNREPLAGQLSLLEEETTNEEETMNTSTELVQDELLPALIEEPASAPITLFGTSDPKVALEQDGRGRDSARRRDQATEAVRHDQRARAHHRRGWTCPRRDARRHPRRRLDEAERDGERLGGAGRGRRTLDGRVVGAAGGECSRAERKWEARTSTRSARWPRPARSRGRCGRRSARSSCSPATRPTPAEEMVDASSTRSPSPHHARTVIRAATRSSRPTTRSPSSTGCSKSSPPHGPRSTGRPTRARSRDAGRHAHRGDDAGPAR